MRSANVMIEECQDKICYLTQERDYARTHQKIVEIPVEKPVLYEKCEACNRTAYQNAKAKYETQKERLAGQYKAKTVMFQTTLFLLAWYSLTTTLFQAVQSDMFLVDCKSFFNDLASFIQTFVGWTIDAGHSAAQISTKIPNAFIAGMVYWLLLILIVGICMAGTGMLAILIEIKVIELYKKNCCCHGRLSNFPGNPRIQQFLFSLRHIQYCSWLVQAYGISCCLSFLIVLLRFPTGTF